jgi:uncharacterized protein YceK
MKNILTALVVFGILTFSGCATPVSAPAPTPEAVDTVVVDTVSIDTVPADTTPRNYHVEVPDFIVDHLVEWHLRLEGHSTLPNVERVICLQGVIKDSVLSVTGILPPKIYGAATDSVAYEDGDCRLKKDHIGTWHNHPKQLTGDGCWRGSEDWFLPGEHLMLISCVPDFRKGVAFMVWTR